MVSRSARVVRNKSSSYKTSSSKPKVRSERSVRVIRKKPSSYKASVAKPKVRSERVAAAARDTSTNTAVKHPLRAMSSVLKSSDSTEFTPQTINDQCCLARTWDDGHGGQCTRRPLNCATQLCAAHKFESDLPLGLTHGLVTGAIPTCKLEQFKRVRAFREAARQVPRLEGAHLLDVTGAQGGAMNADDDITPASMSSGHGDGRLRSVKCWHPKIILPRRRPGACVKGGKIYSKELFEQLAVQASNNAPDHLFQHDGYSLPLLGSVQCTLVGFERDLDGIRPTTISIYEWRFFIEGIEGVNMTCHVKHKCRNLCYGSINTLRPPWQVRAAACVVHPSVNTFGVY